MISVRWHRMTREQRVEARIRATLDRRIQAVASDLGLRWVTTSRSPSKEIQ